MFFVNFSIASLNRDMPVTELINPFDEFIVLYKPTGTTPWACIMDKKDPKSSKKNRPAHQDE